MSPRTYRLMRRAESAEETRRRIVQATYDLHGEQGIAATTVRDIARRADVSVGTVYHHFPTYDDVIAACGHHTAALMQPPAPGILSPIRGSRRRVRALAEAFFGFYRRFPAYARVRADRDRFARLDEFLREDEETRRTLIAEAVAPRTPSRRAAAVAFALLDISVYQALTGSGLTHAAAVDAITPLLEDALLGRRRTKEAS